VAVVADCGTATGGVCSATAEAQAGVLGCTDDCEAESIAVAVADDGATNAVASGFATAVNNSNASNNNTAIAEGTFNGAPITGVIDPAIPGDDCEVAGTIECFTFGPVDTFGSSAVATGNAVAVNGSEATQSSTALATNGVANSNADALACVTPVTFAPNGSGCDATAHSVADANKGVAVSIADATSFNGGSAFANSAQTADGGASATNSLNSAAGGSASAVADGANNVAIANAVGTAGAASQTTTTAISVSAVNSGQFGAGVSQSTSCASGQQTCATANGLALAQSTEGGIAISDSQATAVNGQNAASAAGAMAGTSCQTAPVASGSFVANPDGSFTYNAGMNAGFACTSATSGTAP
jgi:hypothetical protein